MGHEVQDEDVPCTVEAAAKGEGECGGWSNSS